MSLAPGGRLGPYEVLAKLGEGGMGVVYRAHDDRLDRDVALKVLPAEALGDETSRARLLREARSAAALNHPHICTIHEVGEVEGQAFIAMEFIDGQPLDRVIPPGGMTVEQVLRYGVQIADAVAHAHASGVVHRDLKSANVVVTRDQRAKVLGFGLAKRVSKEALAEDSTRIETSMTQPGTVVGTLPYMAPERLRGDPATARSDVWALGVMLYELASGLRPFRGQTGFEVSSAILSQPPPPLPANVPRELRMVIERCLAKEPGARYQQASEVCAAIEAIHAGDVGASLSAWARTLSRRWMLGAVAAVVAVAVGALVGFNVGVVWGEAPGLFDRPRVRSIAVLPLANLTGDPDQEYFADGIHDALITDLATLSESLRVTSRTSVLGYKDGNRSLPDIAEELGVDAVLTGSVMRVGDRVQITGQLIDAATEEHLWAERYERDLENVLTLQDEIVTAIAGAIEVRLTPAADGRLATARAVNPEAYESYLRGRTYLERFTPEDLDTAMQYFEQALEEDPNDALAHAGVSAVWGRRVVASVVPAREAGTDWKGAAQRALALDDTLAEAHGQLAQALTWVDWDWEGAEAEFQRAIALNPNYADVRVFYSHFLTALGRPDEAEPHILRALELDPLVAFNHAMHGVQLTFSGRDEDAEASFEKAFQIDPNLGFGRAQMVRLRARQGRYEEALERLRAFREERGDDAGVEALTVGAAEGGYEGAVSRLTEVQAARPEATSINAFFIAVSFAEAGQVDKVFEWLEYAVAARDLNMVYVGVQPAFRTEGVRGDPRFTDLLRRMNLPL